MTVPWRWRSKGNLPWPTRPSTTTKPKSWTMSKFPWPCVFMSTCIGTQLRIGHVAAIEQRWTADVDQWCSTTLQETFATPLYCGWATEDRLLTILQLPHPEELLHVARLRQLTMCLKRANQQFWALVGMDGQWLQEVCHAAKWMHAQVDGLTSLPPPLSYDSLAAWQDYMMTEEKKFIGTLKRAQLHAIMQRGIHADVQHFHRRLFAILEQGGLHVTARDTAPMTVTHRMHRCLICQTEWDNYRSWAVHCFKRHQRLSAFRQLQTGNRCEACGRLFSNHTRLTRHFRSVPACARTLAAQQRWSAPQPAMGSKLVSEAMPYDSMIPYIDTNEPVLPERAGWAMTDATMRALRQTSAIDWRYAEEPILQNLEAGLRELPLHYTEFDQVIQAQLHYYEGNEIACQTLHAFATSFSPLFGEVRTCTVEPTKPSPDHLKDLTQLEFRSYTPPLRGHPRFHYILHVFAGAKRDGDLHSCLEQVPCEDGAMFFPISLDVILDPEKGDLLNSDVQAFWLDKTLRGLVYATVAGPPCESWSISRWRQLEDGQGPRPVRSAADLFYLIWSLNPLKIRELRQTSVGNLLLQFSLLMMAAHCVTNTLGILEHPSAPPTKPAGIPPSIWRLPVVQLMRRHRNISLTHIKQGYFGAKAPKPTTFMIVGPPSVRASMIQALQQGRTTSRLPPPLRMGRTEKGFATLPLKRYPVGLCRAIASALHRGLAAAPSLSNDSDDVFAIAEKFRIAYETTVDGEDGQDYCGKKNPGATN